MQAIATGGTANETWTAATRQRHGAVAEGHPVASTHRAVACDAQRNVFEQSLAIAHDPSACLALVVETEGSTYAKFGSLALFRGSERMAGWLSGGCLESLIADAASAAAKGRRTDLFDIDTRDDSEFFGGSAVGCRGRIRIALIPLAGLPGWVEVVSAWLMGESSLRLGVSTSGNVSYGIKGVQERRIDMGVTERWLDGPRWTVEFGPSAQVLVFGAGPETAALIPLLRSLGWVSTVVERRASWGESATLADETLQVVASIRPGRFTAALVMTHNFELDWEALNCVADSDIPFVGLLGPERRRKDLFRVLSSEKQTALGERLRSPVGLSLGGWGAEAISLSIAAQLHAFRHQN